MARNYYISKEKITGDKGLKGVINKITQEEWETAVDANPYWVWYYDTEEGQESYEFLKKLCEESGEVPKKENKKICGDYDKKKKYAKIYVTFSSKLGYIDKHHWTKQTKRYMQELYKLSQAIPGAMLLRGYTKVVTQEDIDQLK